MNTAANHERKASPSKNVIHLNALSVYFICLVTAVCILELTATSPLVYAVFEEIGLRWLWPLLVLGLACIYILVGKKFHRANGMPQYFPWWAVLTLLATTFAVGMLLMDTAAEWSLFETCVAMLILSASVLPATVGYIAYAEWWRLRWNQQVVDVVVDTLPGGKKCSPPTTTQMPATQRTKSPFRKIFEDEKHRHMWGAPHCLGILENAFVVWKERLNDCAGRNNSLSETYSMCVDMGDDLFHYMEARWPSHILNSLSEKKLELLRELITIWLSGSEEQREQYGVSSKRWILPLNEQKDPYYRFLSMCFDLGVQRSENHVIKQIENALDLYREISKSNKSIECKNRECEVCQNTWLAFAHNSVGERPCFDTWMAMRRMENQRPIIETQIGRNTDVALLIGKAWLISHYRRWSQETHADWHQGFDGAANIMERVK